MIWKMKAGKWPGAGVCVSDSPSSCFAGIIFKPHTALSRGCFPVLERYSIAFQLSRLHVALKKISTQPYIAASY